jgi:transcriptional regulator with XRE-family HTH domain
MSKPSPRDLAIKWSNLLLDAKLPPHTHAIGRKLHIGVPLLQQMQKGKLPPNHPYIDRLATTLGVSESDVRYFAHGRPISHKEQARLTSRLAGRNGNGTNGKGHATATLVEDLPKKRGGKHDNPGQRKFALARDRKRAEETQNPLMLARLANDVTISAFAKIAGVSTTAVRQAESGRSAPNSPLLERLAPAYGLPLEELQAFQTAKPMPDWALAGARARTGKPTAHRPKHSHVEEVVSPHGGARPGSGPRPRLLKKMPLAQREQLRTLTNTVNLNSMKGIKETTVQTQMLAEFLRQYYNALGIEGTVVLDFVFDRLFD